jgi:hypothetical protein
MNIQVLNPYKSFEIQGDKETVDVIVGFNFVNPD